MSKLGTYKVNGIPIAEKITGGNAWFVQSVDGNNEITAYGNRPDRPFATIDYAINQSASGDTIYVLERHRETLNSSIAFVPDVPKLSIIGIGEKNNRPVISLSTSGTNETRIGITGANTRISNITFRANSTSVGSSSVGIRIAAADVTLDNCMFDHNSTLCYFANVIEVPAGTHRATLSNCEIVNFSTTGQSAKAIDLSGTAITNHLTLKGNIFSGCWTTAVVRSSTDFTARGFNISDNIIYNNSTIASDPCINMPSSAESGKGGRGNFFYNNTIITGSSGGSTQIFIIPWYHGGKNKFMNSSGGKVDPGVYSS